MKTAELTPPLLDWWVHACVDGMEHAQWRRIMEVASTEFSTDWAQGGPIIEREGLGLERAGVWHATTVHGREFEGPTPLIAAMRAKVASVYGETVPDETP